MLTVSSQFEDAVKADVKSPQPGVLISWAKNYDPDVKFAKVDHSYVDGPDKVKGGGDTVTFFGKYDYINETRHLRNFRITRKISKRPWGVIMATAEIELNNTSKRFTPDFDEEIGEYVGLPDRPVKLVLGFNGEYIKLFTGYTERPKMELLDRVVKLQAFDAMTYLSTRQSDLDAFVDTPMHEIIAELLIEQGFSPDQFELEPSLQQPIGYLMPKDRYITDLFNEMCEAEGYILFADEDGIIHGWNRLHLIGNQTPVWKFTYSNMEDLRWSSSTVINSAQAVAKPFKPAAWNKIFELDGASEQTMVPPGGSTDIFVEFKDDIGPFPAITVEDPVHVSLASGGSSYVTNKARDGSSPDTGAADITLASTYNFGNKYRMTFSNSGDSPVYITKITLFGQPAKVTAVKGVIQSDQDSIDKYGINPDNNHEVYVIENDLIQDTATANTMAWLLVQIQKSAHANLNIDNFIVPHLQFGDAVEVEIRDTEETKYCNIFGIELFCGVDANMYQKLYVEERETKQYARVDQSYTDGPDFIAL